MERKGLVDEHFLSKHYSKPQKDGKNGKNHSILFNNLSDVKCFLMPKNSRYLGMNIHKSQLFCCEDSRNSIGLARHKDVAAPQRLGVKDVKAQSCEFGIYACKV